MGIYRLRDGKMITGICAGLADKYKIDPVIVRLGAVFLTVFTGIWPGVITYLIASFIIPEVDHSPKKDL
ncbi:MAG: PspC domain-containing protein [Chitinispirillales bacterium]|jgi:phage shock protein C|nr:PspC domain-containing protein [Chitinispirillales bacterium]